MVECPLLVLDEVWAVVEFLLEVGTDTGVSVTGLGTSAFALELSVSVMLEGLVGVEVGLEVGIALVLRKNSSAWINNDLLSSVCLRSLRACMDLSSESVDSSLYSCRATCLFLGTAADFEANSELMEFSLLVLKLATSWEVAPLLWLLGAAGRDVGTSGTGKFRS